MNPAIRRVKSAGPIELADLPSESWQELGIGLADAMRDLEGRWLILVDELPRLVLKLLDEGASLGRVRDFLLWLRSMRQGRPGVPENVNWLLAGSIGLDTLTRRLRLGDTINDLFLFHLGPFSAPTAHKFLLKLGDSYSIPLDEAVRTRICERAGWLIPFHLQIFFAHLRYRMDERGEPPRPEDVDAIFEELLTPANRAYFDYWSQRLREELGSPDAERAHELLTACAASPAGARLSTLGQLLARHVQDDRRRAELQRYLLARIIHE
jgi:hypothetical protein